MLIILLYMYEWIYLYWILILYTGVDMEDYYEILLGGGGRRRR